MRAVSKYEYSLSLTSQFYFCGVPFRLDTSPKCNLNCGYCFAMARGGRRTSTRLLARVESLRRKLGGVFEEGKIESLNSQLLARKIPVHFGGLSDPFSNATTSRVSKSLLQLLAQYDYPVVLSTKNSEELIKDDTVEVLRRIKKLVIQISVTSASEDFARTVEPNAPTTEQRTRAMEKLSRDGFYCICRVQPLFVPQLKNVERELIPMLGERGCRHVIVEHLKLPVEKRRQSFDRMLKKMCWDAYGYYKGHGMIVVGREWMLPNQIKWDNVQGIVDAIHKYRMTYGAGDYGLHHLGDTACCCGIDCVPGFEKWYRANFANIIRNAKGCLIGFREVAKQWRPVGSIKRILNSRCRSTNMGHNMLDYLKRKWNSPGTPNAPDAFMGVKLYGSGSDGNCVYVREGSNRGTK